MKKKRREREANTETKPVKFLFMTSSTLIEYFFPKINEIPLKKVY